MIYAGLVVGGPMDGQRFSYYREHFQVAQDRSRPVEMSPMAVADAAFQVHTYNWTTLFLASSGKVEISVWAPHEWTKVDILSALLEGYKPTKGDAK